MKFLHQNIRMANIQNKHKFQVVFAFYNLNLTTRVIILRDRELKKEGGQYAAFIYYKWSSRDFTLEPVHCFASKLFHSSLEDAIISVPENFFSEPSC